MLPPSHFSSGLSSSFAANPCPWGGTQTASRFPFRWCGMKPTVSGISQLDAPPGLHGAQEEALDASEPRYAKPRGYADSIQSAYVRTGVNKIMTRFVPRPYPYYVRKRE